MLDIDFKPEKYVAFRYRNDNSIEMTINELIDHWLADTPRELQSRVFVIAGWPGVGKTWFSRNTAHTRANSNAVIKRLLHPQYCDLLYINVRELLFDRTTYPTVQASINRWETEIAKSTAPRLCLCVDHIPGPPMDTSLKSFEDQVLFPALQQGAFLLLIQDDLRKWGLGGRIPHKVNLLPPFQVEGINRILEQEVVSIDNQAMLAEHAAGHPLLARYLAREGLEKGSRYFLSYWLEQKHIAHPSLEELMEMAYPLLGLEDLSEVSAQRKLGLSRYEANRAFEYLGPLAAGWIDLEQRDGQRWGYCWVSPIKRCLEYLKPNLPN